MAGRVTEPPAVVLLAGSEGGVARALHALLPTLGPDVPLLAGGGEDGRRALVSLAGDREVVWLDAGGPAAWNAAAARVPGSDLVVVDAATEVGAGWLEALVAAGEAEPDAATVTAVSNDAGYLSVPRRNLPWPLLPPSLTVADAAARVRSGALGLHPRIPVALPHCALVRRAALQLVGSFDEGLPARDALAEFCARATAAGLVHVAADEVFVAHRGSGGDVGSLAAEARHPWLAGAVEQARDERHGAFARALLSASVTLEPLGVTVDARSLAGGVTGTTVQVIELLGALSSRRDVRVRALLPDVVGEPVRRALDAMDGVERLGAGASEIGRTHVVHRPWQIESVAEMAFLDTLGERTVVTNQDLIGYRTPSVFESARAWRDYRAATRDALGLAAVVTFFTPEAAADAAADDLVAEERVRVVRLGADEGRLAGAAREPLAPSGLADRGQPFLLLLGNRYRHKNAQFALELLGALRDEHGWDGDLVLAGAEVLHGSGSDGVAAWLLRHPAHADHVVQLGAVSEEQKAWLLREAAAVVYPSTYEGFGLIPFEAAAAGTPCLVARVSALRDTIPAPLAVLTPWDTSASARDAIGLLRSGEEAAALVGGIRDAGAKLTWAATAEALSAAYHDAVRLPAPPAARLSADLGRAEHDYWTVRDGVPGPLWRLVRPDAPLLDEPLATDLTTILEQPSGRARLLRAMRLARKLPGRS